MEMKVFALPFTNQTIHLDTRGAQYVAWLACRKAEIESPPIQSRRRYARRMATFICGSMAAGGGDGSLWEWIFRDFLAKVHAWIDKACSICAEDEPEWHVFYDHPEIAKKLALILLYLSLNTEKRNHRLGEPQATNQAKGENHEGEKLLQDHGNGAHRLEGDCLRHYPEDGKAARR